ncbi:MAG TPA: flagellar hook-basal body complex protein FliE [Alphaproteobacteria bacterium]|nr:flagellar hook-basal body complex protein FliE [Alphaproteobacteria bacterium]
MVSLASAAAAYANAAAQTRGPGLEPRSQATGQSFTDLVKDAVGEARDALQQGEKLSMSAAAGKADLTQVVTAVTNADVALQAVVAVRDKVIQAYQSVLSMPL